MSGILKTKTTFLTAFLLITLSLVGCSTGTESSANDKNITVIKTVLQEQFTGPDQELIDLLEDHENATIIGEGETATPKSPTKLDQYLEEKYKAYFTENTYERFIGAYAMDYQTSAYYGNYTINVKTVDVEEKESAEGYYDFTVHVFYQKDGEEENKTEVVGRAAVNEEAKITNLHYHDDGNLSRNLNE